VLYESKTYFSQLTAVDIQSVGMAQMAIADPFFGHGWGRGIVGLILLVLAIIAILDVLKSSKPVEQKILWVIVILVVPLIGLILYYLIGKK
jgi:apolipoprotein N-acyltransferase